MRQPCVYMLASKNNGTIYIGVTSDLLKRVWQHKNKQASRFTKRYSVEILVYYELHEDIGAAITREKQLKKWKRRWKMNLIQKYNPDWKDLWPEIL
ncbi:MAG: GIY-YIG nuclease family protein [Pseudomonadota bacterium]